MSSGPEGFNDFKGKAKPLDDVDIPTLAFRLRVSEDHLRAVVEVEAGGRPFDKNGRPAMLFEPHVFWRNLRGDLDKQKLAVEQGLAYRDWKPGNYPSDSYLRLMQAARIDETAAFKSASWGASQVLGENHAMLGYPAVQHMVRSFMDDAENHIEGMVRFILANSLADDIRAGRWANFARVYNGPGYARNGYDRKLAAAYAKWSKIEDVAWAPDAEDPARPSPLDSEQLKGVQHRLAELGYPEVGRADGAWGTRTRAAVLAFRSDNGLPTVAQIDDAFLQALSVGKHRVIARERYEATVDDLRDAGSKTVSVTDTGKTVGVLVTSGGLLGAAVEILEGVLAETESMPELRSLLVPISESVGIDVSLLLVVVGAYSFWSNGKLQQIRLKDHQTGKNLGR